MVFTEIELKNIRQFDQKKFIFHPNIHLITLGSSQGKSSLIESLRSALSFIAPVPSGFFKEDATESSVILKLEIAHEPYVVTRQWKEKIQIVHTVEFPNGNFFDLTDPVQKDEWISFFLNHMDSGFSGDNLKAHSGLRAQRYDFILNLIFPGLSIRQVSEDHWLYDLFNMRMLEYIKTKLLEMQRDVTDHLTALKGVRQNATLEQKVVDRFESEIAQTDSEIKRINALIVNITTQAEEDESNLHQAERIHEFISTKKNEMERIDFEIRSYRSLLKNDSAGEFSDEEIQEITQKKKQFDQLKKRENILLQKLIERKQLEKNLNGIISEIGLCRIQPGAAGDTTKLLQLDTYQTEVTRIRGMLKALTQADQELDTLKQEKNIYQAAYDKYLVLEKLKKLVTVNEQNKIQSVIQKLANDREVITKELEQMQSSIHEDRFRTLVRKVQQKRQQIIEQRTRLEELYEKRLHTLRAFEETLSNVADFRIIENDIRKQIDVRKFISLMTEAAELELQEIYENQKVEFLKKAAEQVEGMDRSFVKVMERLLQNVEKHSDAHLVDRYSHSELTLFNVIFRLLCLSYIKYKGSVVLDEHYRRMMDRSQVRKVDTFLKSLGFPQVISFETV